MLFFVLKLEWASKSIFCFVFFSFYCAQLRSDKIFGDDPHFQDFLLAAKLGRNAANQKGEGGRDTDTAL